MHTCKGLFPLRLRVALRGERQSAIASASTTIARHATHRAAEMETGPNSSQLMVYLRLCRSKVT